MLVLLRRCSGSPREVKERSGTERNGMRMPVSSARRRWLLVFVLAACCILAGIFLLSLAVGWHDSALKSKNAIRRVTRRSAAAAAAAAANQSPVLTVSERFWSTIDDSHRASNFVLSGVNSVCDQNFGVQFLQSWKADRTELCAGDPDPSAGFDASSLVCYSRRAVLSAYDNNHVPKPSPAHSAKSTVWSVCLMRNAQIDSYQFQATGTGDFTIGSGGVRLACLPNLMPTQFTTKLAATPPAAAAEARGRKALPQLDRTTAAPPASGAPSVDTAFNLIDNPVIKQWMDGIKTVSLIKKKKTKPLAAAPVAPAYRDVEAEVAELRSANGNANGNGHPTDSTPALRCDTRVSHPVIFVRRRGKGLAASNLYHAQEDLLQTYVSLALLIDEMRAYISSAPAAEQSALRTAASGVEVIFIDGKEDGPFIEYWHRLFGAGSSSSSSSSSSSGVSYPVRFIYTNPYPPRTCFNFAVVAPWSGTSLLSYSGVGTPSTCFSVLYHAFTRSARDSFVAVFGPSKLIAAKQQKAIKPAAATAATDEDSDSDSGDDENDDAESDSTISRLPKPPTIHITFVTRQPETELELSRLNQWQLGRVLSNEPELHARIQQRVARWNQQTWKQRGGSYDDGLELNTIPTADDTDADIDGLASVANAAAATVSGKPAARKPLPTSRGASALLSRLRMERGKTHSKAAAAAAAAPVAPVTVTTSTTIGGRTTTRTATAASAASPHSHAGDDHNAADDGDGESILVYETVSFSSMRGGFSAQTRVVGESDVLVGVHGAGLAHITFLPPWSEVVELFPPGYSSQRHFGNMANWRGDIHYSAVPIDLRVDANAVWSRIRDAVKRVLATRKRHRAITLPPI